MLRLRKVAVLLVAVGALALAGAPSAPAAQIAHLYAAFDPNILGSETNVEFGFAIENTDRRRVPSPLTHIVVHLPPGLVFITSDLGVDGNCEPSRLQLLGLSGCPAEAEFGLGRAVAELEIEETIFSEEAHVAMLIGLPNPEHFEALLYAVAATPVSAELIFPAALYLETGPSGSWIEATIPPVLTAPGLGNISLTSFNANFGPRGLTYYRHIHHEIVTYKPAGLVVPKRCPRRGFRFSALFRFEDGSEAGAVAHVPCPRPGSGAKR
jgi:hypothetical protein